MVPDERQGTTLPTRDSALGIATLLGRLLGQLVPVALVAVLVESVLALSMYPALRDVLQENWLSLGLRLWTVSIAFVLALAVVTASVTYGLQAVLGRRAMFLAGAIVTMGLIAAAAPVVLRVVFPSRIPWDRSLLAVVIAFAVATPVVSALFGFWVRLAMSRRTGMVLGSAAGLAALMAAPGFLYDLNVKSAELLPVSSRAAQEPGLLVGDSVILITVDTLRASHMSLYGYGRSTTPGIDAWAREQTVFTHAITPRTFTAPAVASLMTGVYPGLHGVGQHPDRLPDAMVTLGELFAEHGYRTAAYVTNPALHRPTFNFGQGFAEWHTYPEEQSQAAIVLQDAREFLSQPDESPFFLWIHLLDPHSPYRPPPPHDTRFVGDEFYERSRDVEMRPASGGWAPGEVSLRDALGADWAELGLGESTLQSADYLVSQYDGEVAYADEQIASFLEHASRRHPEALVVLTADHGESLVEHEYFFTHGRFCYEPTARIPLVVAHPRLEPGRVDDVVSLVDVLPTLVDFLDLRSPLVLDGRSLSGLLTGELRTAAGGGLPNAATGSVRLGARSTNSYPTLCLRSRQWKLVLTPARFTQPLDLLLESQLRLAGTELPQHFFRTYQTELYDLDVDPDEIESVASSQQTARSQLQDQLWATMFKQRTQRNQLGGFYEPEIQELDEDTLRELRTLRYVR